MKTGIDAPLLAALPYRGAVVASYATTAAAATIKQYLIVAWKATWGLDFDFSAQPETKV
ncbi:MAG: hypothetical protein Q8O29_17420 [Polaromonas sp.]|uniref:hypothetical protein n=1 Tax=Polaromonas sp. TaxID=1869339 RepID=UPI002735DD24|nr:hypothetical protein [Polaromonas sp.]MDP2820014.1 hypothetical protein [Polaromonas sp.]